MTAPPPPLIVIDDDREDGSDDAPTAEEMDADDDANSFAEDDADSFTDEVASGDMTLGRDRDSESSESSKMDEGRIDLDSLSNSAQHGSAVTAGDLEDHDSASVEKDIAFEATRHGATSPEKNIVEEAVADYSGNSVDDVVDASTGLGGAGGVADLHVAKTEGRTSLEDSGTDPSNSDEDGAEVLNSDMSSVKSTRQETASQMQDVEKKYNLEGMPAPPGSVDGDDDSKLEQNANTDKLAGLGKEIVLPETIVDKVAVENEDLLIDDESFVEGGAGMRRDHLFHDSPGSLKDVESNYFASVGSSESIDANSLERQTEEDLKTHSEEHTKFKSSRRTGSPESETFNAVAEGPSGEGNLEESLSAFGVDADEGDFVDVDEVDDVESDDANMENGGRVPASTEGKLPEEAEVDLGSEAHKRPSGAGAMDGLGEVEAQEGVAETEHDGDESEAFAVTPERSLMQTVDAVDVTMQGDDATGDIGDSEAGDSFDFQGDESLWKEDKLDLSDMSEEEENDDDGVNYAIGNDGNEGLSDLSEGPFDLGSHEGVVSGSKSHVDRANTGVQ